MIVLKKGMIWMVSHEVSFWHHGKKQLGDGLFCDFTVSHLFWKNLQVWKKDLYCKKKKIVQSWSIAAK